MLKLAFSCAFFAFAVAVFGCSSSTTPSNNNNNTSGTNKQPGLGTTYTALYWQSQLQDTSSSSFTAVNATATMVKFKDQSAESDTQWYRYESSGDVSLNPA